MSNAKSFSIVCCFVVSLNVGFAAEPVANPEATPITFSRDVRPILSDHCFACHGPDEQERQADLRLDEAAGVGSIIDANNPAESLLLQRIVTKSSDEVMPPPEFDKPLSGEEVSVLRAWVLSGGTFQGHWAFQAPTKSAVAPQADHPVDHFINETLRQKRLNANARADDATLMRRVCLAVSGLPPTREQMEQLGEDFQYEAFVDELLASRSFAEHFGRHWLDLVRYADTHGLHLDNYREMWPYRDWVIDAIDQNMPFDQFVTEQLAGDLLPAATIQQQIASGFNRLNVTTSEGGSIYEEVFARNVIDRTDAFGTIFLGLTTQCAVCHDHKFDPITMRDYYSLFAFFNSLDGRALDGNKKDHPPVIRVPSPEQDREIAELDAQLVELRAELAGPIETVDAAQRAWEASLTEPAAVSTQTALRPTKVESSAGASLQIDADGKVTLVDKIADRDTHTFYFDVADSWSDTSWKTLRLEALADQATRRVGVSNNGNVVLTEFVLSTRRDDQSAWDALPIREASADIEQSDGPFAVSYAIDSKHSDREGWAAAGHQHEGPRVAWFGVGELSDRIAQGHRQIRVQLFYQSVFAKHQFRQVRFSLSDAEPELPADRKIELGPLHVTGPFAVESAPPAYGRSFASQQAAFKLDEVFRYQDRDYRWEAKPSWEPANVIHLPQEGDGVNVSIIHRTIRAPSDHTISLLLGTSDGHSVYLNGKRVAETRRTGPLESLANTYELNLKQGDNDLYFKTVSETGPSQLTYAFRAPGIEPPARIREIAAQRSSDRSADDRDAIRRYYREVVCTHPDWTAIQDLVSGIERSQSKIQESMPTTLVWKELAMPREATILKRGQYDQPGDSVSRSTPAFLPAMAEDAPRNRLGLARWLMQPDHPLTARVAVNRYWQIVFGSGLVRSSEDFGHQGEAPSHPELLDWLAVDFREHGWDVKRLIKLMVTSEAFCRDATFGESNAIDPANRFFARGPRHRLDAEVLRDQALALSGLLSQSGGGPSVKPPQPKGLWNAVGYTRSNTANFQADSEPEKVFRRSVYIFWKRTSPPPQMSTFDAPSRESCTARRERTNTPLQALLLLNETQYVQAAKHLALRTIQECPGDSTDDRIDWLIETATARKPRDSERKDLTGLHDWLRGHYAANPDAASAYLSVDDMSVESVDNVTLATWTVLASTVLNLDELLNN